MHLYQDGAKIYSRFIRCCKILERRYATCLLVV